MQKKEYYSIDAIPDEVKKVAQNVDFQNNYGPLNKNYPKVIFDKEFAQKKPDMTLISFGHSLLEALVEAIFKKYSDCLKEGAIFEDPSHKYHGFIWFFEGVVKNGRGEIN